MFRAMFVGPRPAVATKAGESGLQKVSCCSGDSSCGHAIVLQFSRKCMARGPSRFSWLPVGIFLSNCIRFFGITLCIFVFFLYFSSPSQIALCPFVFFAFFRHAVKEQNRESINVCCILLSLIILPCSVLYFFCNLELYFFWGIFNDYRVHSL